MKNLRVWQAVAVVSQIGFVFAAAVAIGLFLGTELDARLGTSPVFALLGALCGVVSGIFSSIKMARSVMRNGPSRQ